MNAKQTVPLIAALAPAIPAIVPPLIIGGVIFFALKWLCSDDNSEKKLETALASGIPRNSAEIPLNPPVSAPPALKIPVPVPAFVRHTPAEPQIPPQSPIKRRQVTRELVVTNNGISETLTYDLDGNLASVVTATSTNIYQWDAANRLVGITNGANQSQFSYDGLGRRVEDAEVQSGVATDSRFVWCGTELCEQRDSTGTNVTKRFFNGGEQISGTNYYFTRDHLGSVREMMDSAGAIRVRYDYDPYGRQTVVSGSMSADFAYAGMFVHQPSELNLTFHRSYSADLGRWTNRDPLEEEAGLNLYDYVDNNPINVVDTLGLSSADVTKLYNLYAQELQRMTDAGERLDTEGDSTIGWLNNLLSWIDPKKKGCGDQAADIYLVVVRQAYDDTWTFDIPQIFRPLPHQFVTATSSNPNDPKITIDPWTGTFYEENPDGTGTLLTVPIIPKAKHCG